MVGLNGDLVAIAVDIHPRQASVALVDLNGRLLSRWPVPITSDPAASMRLIIDCMQRIRPTAPQKSTRGHRHQSAWKSESHNTAADLCSQSKMARIRYQENGRDQDGTARNVGK